MREKLLWSAVILLGVLLVLAHSQTARNDSQIGRYQIVAAPQDSIAGVQIFRVDTGTGKTWVKYEIPQSAGFQKPAWASIAEPEPNGPK
jgi:hypothetical protein